MRSAECEVRRSEDRPKNERGVALLIVLLVTALLIALVFEFAYATRVSLRAAVNYRDSQRAEFLARSGVNAFLKFKELLDNTPQYEWTVVPLVSSGDAQLRIRWEDERGKIPIKGMFNDPDVLFWLSQLFTQLGVDQNVLDTLRAEYQKKPFQEQIQFVGELHKFMSEEDYLKVSKFVTASNAQGQKVFNINTAPEEVLKSLGIEPTIVNPNRPYAAKANIVGLDNIKAPSGLNISTFLDVTSPVYTVESSATVGEYTKKAVAVVDRNNISTPLYWRSM